MSEWGIAWLGGAVVGWLCSLVALRVEIHKAEPGRRFALEDEFGSTAAMMMSVCLLWPLTLVVLALVVVGRYADSGIKRLVAPKPAVEDPRAGYRDSAVKP